MNSFRHPTFVLLILLLAAATSPVFAQVSYPAPSRADGSTFGRNLQRTMGLLAASDANHRNTVRILVYGQSITKQNWWRTVIGDLRRQYPHASIVAANRAIGGFAAPLLKRTMEHDVFPFYPDLVLFHVYGNEEDYELIIREIRTRTTAEIGLINDHVTPADDKRRQWHDRHSYEWMRDLALRWQCELIDIRRPWDQYLKDNKLEPTALLRDSVHLNAHGEYLYATLVSRYMRHMTGVTPPQTVQELTPEWKDGRLVLEFEGNRIDLISAARPHHPSTRARVLIDGKPPSAFPDLYAFTRPSDAEHVDWPAVIRVSSQAPRLVEDWTLDVTASNDAADEIRFTVTGSKTGPDGSGTSKERFVSKSGRVVIEPQDWYLARSREYTKKAQRVPYRVTWKSIPLFTDSYEPPIVDDTTLDPGITIAQGLPNGKHRLELIAEPGPLPLIQTIRVYKPSY